MQLMERDAKKFNNVTSLAEYAARRVKRFHPDPIDAVAVREEGHAPRDPLLLVAACDDPAHCGVAADSPGPRDDVPEGVLQHGRVDGR
jgi:hypothetical protein